MSFVTIPSGSFKMGQGFKFIWEYWERDFFFENILNVVVHLIQNLLQLLFLFYPEYDQPKHKVTINSFEMLFTPVTEKMWNLLMQGDIAVKPKNVKPSKKVKAISRISFNECLKYISKLNELDTRFEYRLPSEAEWEYACRAGTKGPVYWGNASRDEFCVSGPLDDVAQKEANAWELYDMLGNVREWCADTWHKNYRGAPKNGQAWITEGVTDRVTRGLYRLTTYGPTLGSAHLRIKAHAGEQSNDLGFRLVRNLRIDCDVPF